MNINKSPGLLFAELGMALFQYKRYKEAKKYLGKALKEDAQDIPRAEILVTLGRTHKALGDLDQASKNFFLAVHEDISTFKTVTEEILEIAQEEQPSVEQTGALKPFFERTISRVFPPKTKVYIQQVSHELVDTGKYIEAESLLLPFIRFWPEEPEALEDLGKAQIKLGKFLESRASFRKATEIDQDRASAHQGLGEVYLQLEDYQMAIDSYDKAIGIDKKNLDALTGRGIAYRNIGDIESSEEDFRRAIKINSDDAYLYRELAETLRLSDDPDKAINSLDEAANLMLDNGDYSEAKTLSQQAIEIDPQYGPAHLQLGKALIGLGHQERGFYELDKAAELLKKVETYLQVAQVYLDQEEYDGTLININHALESQPDNANALALKGKALLMQRNFDDAIEILDKGLEIDPLNIEMLNDKGAIFQALGKQEKALLVYQATLEIDPVDPVANARSGKIYLDKKENEKAITAFDNALRSNPEPLIYAGKGYALSNLYEYDKALGPLDEALRLNPDDALSARFKGSALYHLGRYEQAVDALQLAIDLDIANEEDVSANTYGELGESFRDMGRFREAITAFNKAVKIDENNDWALSRWGEALRGLYKNEKAIEKLKLAIEIDDQNSFAWASLGAANMDLGNDKSALEAFNKAIKIESGDYYFPQAWKGKILIDNELYDEAIEALDATLNLEKTPWALCHKGLALRLKDKKGCRDAKSLFEEAIRNELEYGWAYHQLGICHYHLGQFIESLVALNKAEDKGYTSPRKFVVESLVYGAIEEKKKALAAHKKAEETYEGNYQEKVPITHPILNRGFIYEELGAYDRALNDYEIAAEDIKSIAYNAQAWLYLNSFNDKLIEATDLAKKSVELLREENDEINLGNSLDTLGWVYFKRNMVEEAFSCLHEAHQLKPEDILIEKHLNDCISARKS